MERCHVNPQPNLRPSAFGFWRWFRTREALSTSNEVRAIPTLKGWMVRIFTDGIPANGFTYSVDSEIYQDAALNRVPEDLVAGLMETAERDFRRGLLQELMTAEKATDDDIAAEIDKFKPPRE